MKSTAKKGLLVLIFLVIVTGGVFAQVHGFAVGGRAVVFMPFFKPHTDAFPANQGIEIPGSIGFGMAAQASYNFTDLMGIQAEFLLMLDEGTVKQQGIEYAKVKSTSLLVPILFRVGAALPNGMQLTGLAGPYFTLPLGEAEMVAPGGGASQKYDWEGSLGAMLGGVFGYPLGPGVLFGDLRYSFDFNAVEFMMGGRSIKFATKSAIQLGVGYAFHIGG
jgi:hypothetical protein